MLKKIVCIVQSGPLSIPHSIRHLPSCIDVIMTSPTPTPSLTLTKNSEATLSNEGNAPQDLMLTKSGADVDDEEGKAQFFLTLLFER